MMKVLFAGDPSLNSAFGIISATSADGWLGFFVESLCLCLRAVTLFGTRYIP